MSTRQKRRQPKGRRRQRWLSIGAGSLFVLFVVGVSLVSTGLLGSREAEAGLAPDITLATTQGELALSQMRGDVAVLYFSFVG